MTLVFKRSLLLAAMVVMFAVASTGTASAQRAGETIGMHRIFAGDRAAVFALPEAAPNTVQGYFDPVNGDVIVNLGSGVSLLGLVGEAILEENLTTDPTVIGSGLDLLPPPGQVDESGIGFFNTGGLITSLDPFTSEAAGGPFNLGPLLPAGLRDPADFDQFGFDVDGLPNVFLTYGLVAGGVFHDGFQIISSAAVPEPGSLSLLAVAGLGVIARRRR